MVMDDISMQINIVYGTGENCDMIGGNRFFGELEWDMSSSDSEESSESKEEATPPMVRPGAVQVELHSTPRLV